MSDYVLSMLLNTPCNGEQARVLLEAKMEIERLRAELAEWQKLRDPAVLHANLLRGLPAQLDAATYLHLGGHDQLLAAERDRLRAMADALTELVALEEMRLRLRKLHEMGHGTDYYDYHRRVPLAWDAARAALGLNGHANRATGADDDA